MALGGKGLCRILRRFGHVRQGGNPAVQFRQLGGGFGQTRKARIADQSGQTGKAGKARIGHGRPPDPVTLARARRRIASAKRMAAATAR